MTFDPPGHGERYAPEYPPHGFSDHLPMAWQALGALGAPAARREAFAAAYLPRLTPADPAQRRRVAALRQEIADRGGAAVLHGYLPGLISGWFREAYHPLIRLAYAVEFDVPGELAAALAYLEAAGPCERLARLAQTAPVRTDADGLELLRQAEGWAVDLQAAAGFGARAERVLEQPQVQAMAWTVPSNLAAVSRAALDAFAATHDFFALQLLTGSHAFRVLYPFAGPQADAVLNLGLLAGYVAIGAPPLTRFEPPPDPPPSRERLLASCRDDEHDFKVAYSAWAQAQHWQDPAYLLAVAGYLDSVPRAG